MADCLPLITAAFLQTVTKVDVADTSEVDSLIVIVSTLIGEELGGCVVPAQASMKLRVVCAEYTAFCMTNGAGGGAELRAEQMGDYRVEYQISGRDAFDLQVLRDMLASMYGASTYTVSTVDTRTDQTYHYVEYFDPLAVSEMHSDSPGMYGQYFGYLDVGVGS